MALTLGADSERDFEAFIEHQIRFESERSNDHLTKSLIALLRFLDYHPTTLSVLNDIFARDGTQIIMNDDQVPVRLSDTWNQAPLPVYVPPPEPETEPARRTEWIVAVSVLSVVSVTLAIFLILSYTTKRKK